MTGKTIALAADDGGKFSAYLAVPEAGSGPGLLLLQEIFGVNETMRQCANLFAEEGYVTIVPDLFWRLEPGIELGYGEADFARALDYMGRFDADRGVADAGAALKALRAMSECTGKLAVLGFCLGGRLAYLTAARHRVDAAICFYGVGIEQVLDEAPNISCPMAMHFAGADQFVPETAVDKIRAAFVARDDVTIWLYPEVDHAFYNRARKEVYHRPSALMAHSRSIALLRREMGPHHDLEKLWERHLDYEFFTRDADKTMATMVGEPYVNHVPTMTGGTGHAELRRFYAHHFKCRQSHRVNVVLPLYGENRVPQLQCVCRLCPKLVAEISCITRA